MVFNTNNKHVQNDASAEITSPLMYTNSTQCMEFWYNMPNHMSSLEVYIKEYKGDKKRIWKESRITKGWQRANVLISFVGQFQVTCVRFICSYA